MVRMYHDNPAQTGGPITADVPEDAVRWMQKAGWYLKKEEKPFLEKPARKSSKAPNEP